MTAFKPVVVKENMANLPQKAEFRFTFNRRKRKANWPKRKTVDSSGKVYWRTVKNTHLIDHPTYGKNYSLWRLQKHMDSLVYEDGYKVWNCDRIRETRVGDYNIYYLMCYKIKRSISGVM